jgi:pyridoxal phosphate enzyme (YggS family)
MVSENLKKVIEAVNAAAAQSKRQPESIHLIAVSKTKPVEMIQEAYDFGIRDFGENKVKELLNKEPLLPADIRWHMIGHLQTNKVRQIIGKTALIHSIDSLKLLDTIDFEAKKARISVKGLLEVNVAGEETKFGFAPEELFPLLDRLKQYKNLSIAGLMTVAPNVKDPEENRPVFQRLRQLSIDIKSKNIDNVSMNELSMGMTGDYRVAIEEGATYIRVGTGIFGARETGEE